MLFKKVNSLFPELCEAIENLNPFGSNSNTFSLTASISKKEPQYNIFHLKVLPGLCSLKKLCEFKIVFWQENQKYTYSRKTIKILPKDLHAELKQVPRFIMIYKKMIDSFKNYSTYKSKYLADKEFLKLLGSVPKVIKT